MDEVMKSDGFKLLIGGLILSNFATIGLVIGWIFKGGMFVADTKSGIKDAKDCAVRAHVRIDGLTGEPKTEGA